VLRAEHAHDPGGGDVPVGGIADGDVVVVDGHAGTVVRSEPALPILTTTGASS
jgi:hypothetical protein